MDLKPEELKQGEGQTVGNGQSDDRLGDENQSTVKPSHEQTKGEQLDQQIMPEAGDHVEIVSSNEHFGDKEITGSENISSHNDSTELESQSDDHDDSYKMNISDLNSKNLETVESSHSDVVSEKSCTPEKVNNKAENKDIDDKWTELEDKKENRDLQEVVKADDENKEGDQDVVKDKISEHFQEVVKADDENVVQTEDTVTEDDKNSEHVEEVKADDENSEHVHDLVKADDENADNIQDVVKSDEDISHEQEEIKTRVENVEDVHETVKTDVESVVKMSEEKTENVQELLNRDDEETGNIQEVVNRDDEETGNIQELVNRDDENMESLSENKIAGDEVPMINDEMKGHGEGVLETGHENIEHIPEVSDKTDVPVDEMLDEDVENNASEPITSASDSLVKENSDSFTEEELTTSGEASEDSKMEKSLNISTEESRSVTQDASEEVKSDESQIAEDTSTESAQNVETGSEKNLEPEYMDILGNGLLRKKILKAGQGRESRPVSGETVFLRTEGRLEDGTIVDKSDLISFILGDGDVIQAWDLAVTLMELGEKCELIADSKYAYGAFGCDNIPSDATITYTLELVKKEPGLDLESMTIKERTKKGEAKRERGNFLFTRKEFAAAINSYTKALKILEYPASTHNVPTSVLKSLSDSKVKCYNNLAACQLKIEAYDAAIKSSNKVLTVEPDNVKALFRIGKSFGCKGECENAERYLRKALDLDPQSKILHRELAWVTRKLKQDNASQKEMYRRMMGADKNPPKKKQSKWWKTPVIVGSVVAGTLAIIGAVYRGTQH